MYLLGYDIGSSSIKAALVDVKSGQMVALESYPATEMNIVSKENGWAEQDPNVWWENVKQATEKVLAAHPVETSLIKGIGISYQMHGLVVVDKNQNPLRPSIIWCDSRAVEIGKKAFAQIGEERCLKQLLNSPGNFTASKGADEFAADDLKARYQNSFPPEAIDNIKWYPPVPAGLEAIEGGVLDRVKAAN